MGKRSFLHVLCLAAVLTWTYPAFAAADEEIVEPVDDGGAVEYVQESGDGSQAEPAPQEDAVIIGNQVSPADEDVPAGSDAQSGAQDGKAPSLTVEGVAVVSDPSGTKYDQEIQKKLEELAAQRMERPYNLDYVYWSASDYDTSVVMQTVYSWLRNELGFNHAAACGVLSNIQCESGSNPTAVGDGGTSFGLCQWHNSRCSNLISFCLRNGLSPGSVSGQLAYLKYELFGSYPSVADYLCSVPDTPQGAYDAASFWCWHFEMPGDTASEAERRGRFAGSSLYWMDFTSLEGVDLEKFSSDDTLPMTGGEESDIIVILDNIVDKSQESIMRSVEGWQQFTDDLVQGGKQICSSLESSLGDMDGALITDFKEKLSEEFNRHIQKQE